jgi:hypothetical protein
MILPKQFQHFLPKQSIGAYWQINCGRNAGFTPANGQRIVLPSVSKTLLLSGFSAFSRRKIIAKNRLQQAWLFSHCRLIVSVCQALQPGFNAGPSTGVVGHMALA